jgi:TM2 domain-containing membrane protein YozV
MYYLLINGQRTGPYEAQDIKRMLQQGAIGFDTQFWKDGMLSWETVGAQRHLFETVYQQPTARATQNYGQPQFGQQPMQPYGRQTGVQPYMANPPKSRLAYILLALFLGGFGVHNFYAGYTGKGVAQLLLFLLLIWTIVVPLAIWIWTIVEMVTVTHDAQGVPMT